VTQLSAEASQSLDQSALYLYSRFCVVMSEVNKITPDGLPVFA